MTFENSDIPVPARTRLFLYPTHHYESISIFVVYLSNVCCKIIGKYGDSRKFYAPLWKYAALADPLVEEVHFRQIDQVLTDREGLAIQDWKENSDFPFIIMRDHPKHSQPIPKSMFGLQRKENLMKPLKDSYEKMMIASKSLFKQTDDLEDLLLEALIWPLAA